MSCSPMKIIAIVLKTLQITALAIGTGFVGKFLYEIESILKKPMVLDPYNTGKYGRYEMYLNATGLGMGIAFLGLLFIIAGLQQKKHGAFGLFLLQVICAIQLGVATFLLYKVLHTYEKGIFSTCDLWDKLDTDFSCTQLTIGMVCGFCGAGFFVLDAFNSFIAYTRS